MQSRSVPLLLLAICLLGGCGGKQGNGNPSVTLSATPTAGNAPLKVSFTATGSDPAGGSLIYSWDFGDGVRINNGETGHTHTYWAAGDYSARVTVQNAQGRSATAIAAIHCQGTLVVSLAKDRAPTVDEPVTLTATVNGGGDGFTYTWEFGDGQTATTAMPTATHSYAEPGEKTVRVTVSDGAETGQATLNLYIYEGTELIANGSAESGGIDPTSGEHWADNWDYISVPYSSTISFTRSKTASAGEYSLAITSSEAGVFEFAAWRQDPDFVTIEGKKLRFKTKIKTELSGVGARILVRCDDQDSNILALIQQTESITGNQDWREYVWELSEPAPQGVVRIGVFLMLSADTVGSVYFDEVSLIY